MRPVASTTTFCSSVTVFVCCDSLSRKLPITSTWSFGRTHKPTAVFSCTSMVTARPLGLIIVEKSASRADSKWLTRIGSPAFRGTITRCPTGLSCLSEPSSSTLMNDSVTNCVGISLTAIMSASSSVPSGMSTLAQRMLTVCHLSLTRFSFAFIADQALRKAITPSARAMRRGFLPDSTGILRRDRGTRRRACGAAIMSPTCRSDRVRASRGAVQTGRMPDAVLVLGRYGGLVALRLGLRRRRGRWGFRGGGRRRVDYAQDPVCGGNRCLFIGVELLELVADAEGVVEQSGCCIAFDRVRQVPSRRFGLVTRLAAHRCRLLVHAGGERVLSGMTRGLRFGFELRGGAVVGGRRLHRQRGRLRHHRGHR